MKFLISAFLLLLVSLSAETRQWRNTTGDKSIKGRFIKRDSTSVTIRCGDLTDLKLQLTQIHAEDVRWLNDNHPLDASSSGRRPGTAAPSSGVLDRLNFGDSRAEVTSKLRTSKMFEATVAETFFGRTGLNGIFKSKKTIGGMHGYLYFDWEENGGLSKITWQTEAKNPSAWESTLKPCMNEFVQLLNSIYGKSQDATEKSNPATMSDNTMMVDHVWKLDPKGSVLLGPSKMQGKIQIAVRFMSDDLELQTTEQ